MELSINQFDDIRKFLNGYVMKSVHISGNSLIAKNSVGESFEIAHRSPIFWIPANGQIIETMDFILREVLSEAKANKIWDRDERDSILLKELERIIKLQDKYER